MDELTIQRYIIFIFKNYKENYQIRTGTCNILML